MTLRLLVLKEVVADNTKVVVRKDLEILAAGKWYEDNVMAYLATNLESFTWQDDNIVYIDIKI